MAGLGDRSRRPHHSPHATATEVMEAVVACRRRHPRWGAKKLLGVLRRRYPEVAWPARSTVCDHLNARGLVRARKRRPPPVSPSRSPLTRAAAPNEVWTTDFKGEFRTGDGYYCYPLTVRDAFSRFVLRCDALTTRSLVDTRRGFERAFAQYGLPGRIRSDNGGPFASPGLGGLSRLSVWWIRLGILPERIAPGHPEQNGSHEQFHAVLKAHTTRPPAATPAPSNAGSRRSVPNTTASARTRRCATTPRPTITGPRHARCRADCQHSSIRGTPKSASSAATVASRGSMTHSF